MSSRDRINVIRSPVFRIVALGVLALLILVCVFIIFSSSKSETKIEIQTEEEKVAFILEKLKGVTDADVVRSDDKRSVVVVASGADSILLRMKILDITSSALSVSKSNILLVFSEV